MAQSRMGMHLIGSKGGVTVVNADGDLLAAVGIAGEAGEFDESLAVTGIESVGLNAISS